MKLLKHLLAPALWAALALPAAADKLSLPEISRYLNSIQSAKSDFTQVNSDGTVSKGTLYIKRPGRVRFEYAPPEKQLVLASGGTVAVFDPKSNQGPETYPLSKTPLSIILAKNVDLTRARMVTGHSYDGTATIVTAQDPAHPEYGSIQMKFTGENSPQLRQWVINNDQGKTTVILADLQNGVSLGSSLFNITVNTGGSNR